MPRKWAPKSEDKKRRKSDEQPRSRKNSSCSRSSRRTTPQRRRSGHKMTGERQIKEQGSLRDSPVNFIRCSEHNDPSHLMDKMVKVSLAAAPETAVEGHAFEETYRAIDSPSLDAVSASSEFDVAERCCSFYDTGSSGSDTDGASSQCSVESLTPRDDCDSNSNLTDWISRRRAGRVALDTENVSVDNNFDQDSWDSLDLLDSAQQNDAKMASKSEWLGLENPPPLWTKYPYEMLVNEVVAELQQVSQTMVPELIFPPFDKNANWYITNLAQLFGFNTHVEWYNGSQYIVCIPGMHLDSDSIDRRKMQRLCSRRKRFVRRDVSKREYRGFSKMRDISRRPRRLREGDIVGHDAECICADNFGRQLMVKMGWEDGRGLGQSNSGITTPVPATVKLSKRGLGVQATL